MQSSANYKRVVVKVGSSILSRASRLDGESLENLASQVCRLFDNGIEVILVSSGAVSSGMGALNLSLRPKAVSELQACASIGQGLLMQSYISTFLNKGKHCGQLLLTWDDFNDRKRYLNAKNTIFSLLKFKSVPVINENDTVSTEEIKFGDNDNLSALVAILVKADLLIILSDIDGLLDNNGVKVSVVSKVTSEIKKWACPTKKEICRGGMITKIEAAEKVNNSGISCVIANGRTADILGRLVIDRDNLGTVFLPASERLACKKSWLAYSAKAKGKIIVDDGAKEALARKNKSLLSVGVVKVEGKFKKGDIISIIDSEQREFGRGSVNCSSEELNLIKGKKHPGEIIHRDNLVII